MRFLFSSLLLWLMGSAMAMAVPEFPALTGRVVDDAHILSASTIASLDQSLAEYENGTTNQVVVVTLPSLNGYDIADYGYQLGRHWGIGQKGKDNGVLLIVAPKEHKVRIEVGYGNEGMLTDAASNQIIQDIILPDFRVGKMEQGVVDGTQAVLAVLGGKGKPVTAAAQAANPGMASVIGWLVFMVLIMWFCMRHPLLASMFYMMGGFGGSGRSEGGFGGGGFSGGGGSFGGGGSSGSW